MCIKNRFKNKRLFSFYKRRSFFPPWFRFCRPTPRGPSCAATDAGDLSPCLPIQALQRLKECLKSISDFFFSYLKKMKINGISQTFWWTWRTAAFFFFCWVRSGLFLPVNLRKRFYTFFNTRNAESLFTP